MGRLLLLELDNPARLLGNSLMTQCSGNKYNFNFFETYGSMAIAAENARNKFRARKIVVLGQISEQVFGI